MDFKRRQNRFALVILFYSRDLGIIKILEFLFPEFKIECSIKVLSNLLIMCL